MLFKSLFDYAALGASLMAATASATVMPNAVKRQAERESSIYVSSQEAY